MSLLRPIRLRANPARPGTYLSGRITQDFDGSYSGEKPGYLGSRDGVKCGKRVRFTGSAYRQDLHLAIDYSAPIGTPLYAVHDGKIISQGVDGTGGRFLYLRVRTSATQQIVVLYYHLQAASFQFKQGATVKRGDYIARSGNTGGTSTGGHLHFAMMKGSRLRSASWLRQYAMRFDPQPFIEGKGLGVIL